MFLAKFNIESEDDIINVDASFSKNRYYQLAMRFALDDYKETLEAHIYENVYIIERTLYFLTLKIRKNLKTPAIYTSRYKNIRIPKKKPFYVKKRLNTLKNKTYMLTP